MAGFEPGYPDVRNNCTKTTPLSIFVFILSASFVYFGSFQSKIYIKCKQSLRWIQTQIIGMKVSTLTNKPPPQRPKSIMNFFYYSTQILLNVWSVIENAIGSFLTKRKNGFWRLRRRKLSRNIILKRRNEF